jgi:hypothetical protein
MDMAGELDEGDVRLALGVLATIATMNAPLHLETGTRALKWTSPQNGIALYALVASPDAERRIDAVLGGVLVETGSVMGVQGGA